MRVSVVVPVKNGARYLEEVLVAIERQQIDTEVEVIVVDSGSRDDSVRIARHHGAETIEIPPESFGHGRTRNFAAERSDGDVIVFLTQDATPATDTWLASLVAPLDHDTRVGLSFGPHIPRPDTSPMIARELTEFFAGFTDDALRIDEQNDPGGPATGFFSNVNSAVLRACWEQVRFRDVQYAEDQAFSHDAMAAGWRKAYVPAAGVLHAHDYPFAEFMRRYFDEYRGLRETVGHVEPIGARRLVRLTRDQVAGDLRYMHAQGFRGRELFTGGARSARHHAGRTVAAALGSRHARLPAIIRGGLSLEGRGGGEDAPRERIRARKSVPFVDVRSFHTTPRAPLDVPSPHDGSKPLLTFAWLIPPFRRGSGGHQTIFTIAHELEQRGHSNSIWVHDPGAMMKGGGAIARRELIEHFAPLRAGVFLDFEDWQGADVAMATGWQTAYPLWSLGGCKLKTYLVQDFEPDFYPASADRLWAEDTYRMAFPCITASPWLRDLVQKDYGARAEVFQLGVDFDVYRPLHLPRDEETIVYYARPATPRRATELGLLALSEVKRRRPNARIVLFGDVTAPPAPFEYEFGGVMEPKALASLYNEATLGLVISLTNYSRMPKEMMACGLPVVDIAHDSVVSVFGDDRTVIELAQPDPVSIADRIDGLLGDAVRRRDIAAAAQRFVQGMTWSAAADDVERAVRLWLDQRWEENVRAAAAADPALATIRSHLT